MIVRRVVTGYDPSGKSIFLSDGPPPRARRFEQTPGFASCPVWVTPPGDMWPEEMVGETTVGVTSLHAEAGGSVFLVVTFPPDAVMASEAFDFEKAWPEHLAELPGIAERFEPEAPGMHRTDTLDYAIVMSGEVWLEVDGGIERQLQVHDIIVQQGARHAWRNKSSSPATVAFCMLGRRPRK